MCTLALYIYMIHIYIYICVCLYVWWLDVGYYTCIHMLYHIKPLNHTCENKCSGWRLQIHIVSGYHDGDLMEIS